MAFVILYIRLLPYHLRSWIGSLFIGHVTTSERLAFKLRCAPIESLESRVQRYQ